MWRSLSCVRLWRPHRLYSPWNSSGQNTGVGRLSFLQGFFPTQGLNPGLLHCGRILYQLSHRKAQEYWNGYLPNPGTELGSPAVQADSLPTELWGKPALDSTRGLIRASVFLAFITSKIFWISKPIWSQGFPIRIMNPYSVPPQFIKTNNSNNHYQALWLVSKELSNQPFFRCYY